MKYCKVVWFLKLDHTGFHMFTCMSLVFPEWIENGGEFKNITLNENTSIN